MTLREVTPVVQRVIDVPVAITLDERVISAPTIEGPIPNGQGQITGGGLGGFPANEANERRRRAAPIPRPRRDARTASQSTEPP